jgi:hypothetical protein
MSHWVPERIAIYFLGLFLFTGTAWADGLVFPKAGGAVVLDGSSLAQGRALSLSSKSIPVLAVHPAAPIMASCTPEEGLVFWNVPSFSEASRHQDSLLKEGIVALAFSKDGEHLYLLSQALRAVVDFDLSQSKVQGLVPVPGGLPEGLEVSTSGLVVWQETGLSLLSSDPKVGLLAQFRFPEKVLAAQVLGQRLYVALRGVSGLWSYQLPNGRALGVIPTQAEIAQISSPVEGGGMLLLKSSGVVELRDLDKPQPRWTHSEGQCRFDAMAPAGQGRVVYLYDAETGTVVAVDSQLGTELARGSVPDAKGRPVVFAGAAGQ